MILSAIYANRNWSTTYATRQKTIGPSSTDYCLSISEWFSLLPKAIRLRAFSNTIHTPTLSRLSSHAPTALDWAFIWRNTPETEAFWKNVYDTMACAIAKDDGVPTVSDVTLSQILEDHLKNNIN